MTETDNDIISSNLVSKDITSSNLISNFLDTPSVKVNVDSKNSHNLQTCPLGGCSFFVFESNIKVIKTNNLDLDEQRLIQVLNFENLIPNSGPQVSNFVRGYDILYCLHSMPDDKQLVFYACLPQPIALSSDKEKKYQINSSYPYRVKELSKAPCVIILSICGIIKAFYTVPLNITANTSSPIDIRQLKLWEQSIMQYAHPQDLKLFLKALSKWSRQRFDISPRTESCKIRFKWIPQELYGSYEVSIIHTQSDNRMDALVLIMIPVTISRNIVSQSAKIIMDLGWSVFSWYIDIVETFLPGFLGSPISRLKSLRQKG